MSEVIIDGVKYSPATAVAPSIGIGITTRNRWDVLTGTLAKIQEHTPGAYIVIVDDGSTTAGPIDTSGNVYVHRFEENVGIARAKNKAMELLVNCEHIFLFDDDAYPLVDEWYQPYIDSPEPHLMRIFPDLATQNKLKDIHEVYRDDKHVAYTGARGLMLYVERRVLDVVGGMDPAYGKWGYEHGDWSGRIHNAGLTTWRFGDVINGGDLIYSMDEHEEIDRSVERRERRDLVAKNVKIYRENWDSAKYIEYREQKDVVLTCLYSGVEDPQRPGQNRAKLADLSPLWASLNNRWLVVFSDLEPTPKADDLRTEVSALGVPNLYIQRWIDYWNWLREHPEIRYVWCVDGTDVEMLRDPFNLVPEFLYLGSEHTTVSSGWLGRNHHPAVQNLVVNHPDLQLYNAGLVGGSRAIVMEFLHDMIKLYFDNVIDQRMNSATSITETVNDMGILNVVARRPEWGGRIIFGPTVNSVFKTNGVGKDVALWRHK